jgi:hypothetical protein
MTTCRLGVIGGCQARTQGALGPSQEFGVGVALPEARHTGA